ncbi:MAG: hypothetical protein A3H25_13800 [Sphingomonadales bacterium RIFCSPLOWO2_12_FULL_63_15]|nr:MAG: hypothetical protein A3H25_13800 [Sphingomonadales bacterium RIFCSPLOWO2_12_FULL_63_15]
MKSYSFADLFAGCGGLSLGLSQAGLKGKFAIERDPMAFETFSANFIESPLPSVAFDWPAWLAKQAWDIELLLAQHKDDLVGLQGTIDVLAGGPPCQGFSFAGRRVEGDPRNLLFEKYVEVVGALQPQALILENVPGMRVAHARRNVVDLPVPGEQVEKPKSFYDKLVDSLDVAGYKMEAMLVDSSRFGVPQRRSRLIAVGIRKDLCEWLDGGIARMFVLLEEARLAQLKELGLPEAVSASSALSDLETAGREMIDCTDPESTRGFREVKYGAPTTTYQRLMQAGHDGSMDSMRLARHRDDVRERFARILVECRKGVRMNDESRKTYGLKKHRIYPMDSGEPAPPVPASGRIRGDRRLSGYRDERPRPSATHARVGARQPRCGKRHAARAALSHPPGRNRMNRLASTIADLIRDKLSQAPGGEHGEVRLIFHGPQKEILAKVFDLLAVDGEVGPKVPILLQLPSLAPGEENPPVGVSGCCDDTHLLNLRNSPSQPTFLALVPPGQHSMRSVTSTTDEFGVAAANNGGNVPFEDWWADEFIQELVRVGVGQAGIQEQQQRDDARTLVGRAASAADEMDPERTQRAAAWKVLSRLFSVVPGLAGLTPAQQVDTFGKPGQFLLGNTVMF